MSELDSKIHVREIAGKLARDEALMLDRLVESMRLASFRTYLASTVVSMSSLVPVVLELVQSDIPSALQRLRPGHLWPGITAREAEYGRSGPATNRLVRAGNGFSKRPAPLIGDAVIFEGVFGPVVEAKVLGGSFDVVLREDKLTFSTHDGTGYIRFATKLPDTVIAACAGRPLRDVVEHPMLRSRDYVIADAAQVAGGSSLSFDIGRSAMTMPWRP